MIDSTPCALQEVMKEFCVGSFVVDLIKDGFFMGGEEYDQEDEEEEEEDDDDDDDEEDDDEEDVFLDGFSMVDLIKEGLLRILFR